MSALEALRRSLGSVWLRMSGRIAPRWSEFDGWWYRHQYPDIDIHGIDPWHHFCLAGAEEGRLPNARLARMWAEQRDETDYLQRCLQSAHPLARYVAATTLARWHARQQQWPEVLLALHHVMPTSPAATPDDRGPKPNRSVPHGIRLLLLEALGRTGELDKAYAWLARWRDAPRPAHDLLLARANLLRRSPSPSDDSVVPAWLETVNRLLEGSALAPVGLRDRAAGLVMDNLSCQNVPAASGGPLVSVIVPTYNAAHTLPTTLRSLLSQSWQSLEILVIDDCSTDQTAEVAQSFAEEDARIRLIRLPHNQGAYRTRNTGLHHAQGAFITVHDSDDWSHAQKIERQVQALQQQPAHLISFSHWVRTTDTLEFGGWQSSEGWNAWTHRNASSLMMRRAVFERLGYWDCVRCSADTEYYYRALRVFGAQAVTEVLPGIALSFGRAGAGSLTQQSETSIFTIFGGLRQQYHQSFQAWHQSHNPGIPDSLYLERDPEHRPFPVPQGMLRKPTS